MLTNFISPPLISTQDGDVSRLSSAFGNFGVNNNGGGGGSFGVGGPPPLPSYNGRVSGAEYNSGEQHQYGVSSGNHYPSSGNQGYDNLAGPYPPSFPSGGSQGYGVGDRGGYHRGPGWNQLPRWGGEQDQGQYGSGPPPPPNRQQPSYGGTRGGLAPSYPRHDYGGVSGGYSYGPDGYPTDYGSSNSYGRNDGYGYAPPPPPPPQGGNYRDVPSFVPPQSQMSNGLYPPSFNPGARGSSVPSLDGPYPSSFNPPERTSGAEPLSGGVAGALSSILQTPYNPQQAAQQRRYPAILGGAPDPSPAGDEQGYGGDGVVKPSVTTGLGLNTSGSKSSFMPTRSASSTAASTDVGDVSPTPSNSSGAMDPIGNGATGGTSITLPPPPSEDPSSSGPSILPKRIIPDPNDDCDSNDGKAYSGVPIPSAHDTSHKKREWLVQMNQTLEETPIGQVDPNILPLSTIMNGWAKQKSSEGARMVEMWLDRVHSEYNSENPHGVHPTARMYTMAVDAWAKSNGGAAAARRAEALLERMDRLYREGGGRHEALKPTTGIFNAVINAWARSREKIAPSRAEQILAWMEKLRDTGGEDLDISPDKYTFNTVIHAYAKSGAKESATKAHRILDNMNQMYREGNSSVKPDTITVRPFYVYSFSTYSTCLTHSFNPLSLNSTMLSLTPMLNLEARVLPRKQRRCFSACT